MLSSSTLFLTKPVIQKASLEALKMTSVDALSSLTISDSFVTEVVNNFGDPTLYSFMFPTAIAVATMAVTAGIGGAALFGPILLILFPTLGPQYPLSSPQAAVAVAILIEVFGFSSGLYGYFKRGLVDVKMAVPLAAISIPAAVYAASSLSVDPITLKILYTLLMLGLSGFLLIGGDSDSDEPVLNGATDKVVKTDNNGQTYTYPQFSVSAPGGVATVFGGLLTGLLGVGIGEVTLPQYLRGGVPVSVAAATSVLVVTVTAFSSAFTQILELVSAAEASGRSLATVIPFNLVCYMIPGVVVGGQVAAALQGKVAQEQLEKAIGALFGVIGLAFATLVFKQLQ